MSKRNKKTTLTLKDKVKIFEELKTLSKQEVCEKYEISKSTINRIIQKKENVLETAKTHDVARRRLREGKHPDVEHALSRWFDQMRASGVAISSNMVLEKAQQFATTMGSDFTPNTGWLWRWQKREKISLKRIHGESLSADTEGAHNFSSIVLPSLLEGYALDDIFNADETALFYKALPSSSLTRKNCQIKGFKGSKERITLLFICNASGTFKKVYAIGKPKQPRCFKNKNLPFKYFSQNKAWMTQQLWTDILLSFDNEMAKQKRKVILFVDNAGAHKSVSLNNVKLEFLPPNVTSIIQPLDQGIISNFKMYYRQTIIRKQVAAIEQGKTIDEFKKSINLLTAMHMVNRAWWMVKPTSITNCFRKVDTA